MYHAPPEIELIISGYHGLMERGERQMEKESATARPPHDPIIAVIEPSLKVGVACGKSIRYTFLQLLSLRGLRWLVDELCSRTRR